MNDQIPPLKPRPARRGGTPRVMTAEERVAATQAIDAIEVRTRARAQGLRRLSYLLLTAIIVLLVGGLGVLFYSQILLITNSTEQTNEIKKKQDQIDQEQRDLDKLATDFARLRQDVAAAANAAVPPTVLAFNTLRSVQFAADGKRGWAVGEKGTILRFDPPDLSALDTAIDLKGVRLALSALGITEPVTGPPLKIMEVFEAGRDERKSQIDRDQKDLDARRASLPSLVSMKTDPMEVFTFIVRFSFAAVLFFLVSILVSVYRYSLRLAAHYDARADALGLANAGLDRDFHQLVRSLTPSGVDFGKMDRSPTDQILAALREVTRSRGRG